jgi:uncharacterized membrane protein YgcG
MNSKTIDALIIIAVVIAAGLKLRRKQAAAKADTQFVRVAGGSIPGLSGAAPAVPVPAPAPIRIDGPIRMDYQGAGGTFGGGGASDSW